MILTGIIFVALVMGCDAWTNLNGRVVDEADKPITGARVTLYQGAEKVGEEVTKEDGTFRFRGDISPIDPFFRITITVDGYENYERKLSGKEVQQNRNDKELTIVLKRN